MKRLFLCMSLLISLLALTSCSRKPMKEQIHFGPGPGDEEEEEFEDR